MAKLIAKLKEFFNNSIRVKYHKLKKKNNTNELKIEELQELVNGKDKQIARLQKQNKKLKEKLKEKENGK